MRVMRSEIAESEGFAPQLVRIIYHNSSAAPGEGYKVDLHWQNVGEEPADRNYWIFVHFCPEDGLDEPYGDDVFTWDFSPALQTSRWQTGFVVKEEGCYFRIPAHIKPGRYRVLVGLFDLEGRGDRIELMNRSRDVGGRRYRVGRVHVVPEPGAPSRLLAYRLVWRVHEPEEQPALREPRYLTRGLLAVGFDPDMPVVRGWRIAGQDLPIAGDAALRGPEAEFRDLESGRWHSSLAVDADWVFNSRITSSAAAYRCRLKWKQHDVATLDIRFRIGRNGLQARLASVAEHKGFHLLSVTLPSLVSVRAETPGAALALPSWGGRLVNIAESARHREVHRLNWEEPVRGAVLTAGESLAVLSHVSADDSVVSEVYEAGSRFGALGVQFTTRIPAERPELEFVPRKVSECEITVTANREPGRAAWMAGAALICAGFRGKPQPLFCDSIVYRIVLKDSGGRVRTTFEQAAAIIRRVNALTFGARQVVCLIGWEDPAGGAQTDPDLGSPDGLADLFETAAQSNAGLALDVPGDCVCSRSAHFDPALAALDGRGQPLREPGSSDCFVNSKTCIESGAAAKCVEGILQAFPLMNQVVPVRLASALSSLHDHNPRAQSGADESLAARRAVLDLWRAKGLEVCARGFIQPYVGLCPHFLDAAQSQDGGPFSHEEAIPLVPAIFHGRVTWGAPLDPKYGEAALLLYGSTFNEDWSAETPDDLIKDRYYLVALPWSRLARLAIRDYKREGTLRRVTYANGDYVEADLDARAWRVVCGGFTISETGLSTVPRGRGEMLVYSVSARRVRIPAPAGWSAGAHIHAESPGQNGHSTQVWCSLSDGFIELDVSAREPVLIRKGHS